jgi:hypothetical protein
VQVDGLAELSCEGIREQGWQVGWQDFVCAGGEFGFAPPMVAEESLFLVGGVPGSQGGRGVGDAGELDGLAAVVLLASVAEAGLAVPEVGSEVAEDNAGFLGKFAAGGVGEGLAGVSAAAGQFPPVMIRFVGVFGVDEQHPVVLVEQQHAGTDPEGRRFGGGCGHPVGRSSRRRWLVLTVDAASSRWMVRTASGGGALAVVGAEVIRGSLGSMARRTDTAEWSLSRSARG